MSPTACARGVDQGERDILLRSVYLWHIRTSSIYIPSDGAARNARTAIPNNCFWKCERASLLTTLLSLSFSASPSFFFGEASVRIEVDRTVYRRQTRKMLVRGSSYAMTPSFSPLKSRLHPYFSPYFSLVRPLHLPKDDKSSRRNV